MPMVEVWVEPEFKLAHDQKRAANRLTGAIEAALRMLPRGDESDELEDALNAFVKAVELDRCPTPVDEKYRQWLATKSVAA